MSPAIEVDFSLTGRRVVEVLERLSISGLPRVIKVDNGTEFCSRVVDVLAERNGVKLDIRQPGKPIDNAYIEGFNGRLREEWQQFSVWEEKRTRKTRKENGRHGQVQSFGDFRPLPRIPRSLLLPNRANMIRGITTTNENKGVSPYFHKRIAGGMADRRVKPPVTTAG